MKIRKNNPISFGITLVSANRTGEAKTGLEKKSSTIRRINAMQGTIEQVSIHDIACPRMKLPPQCKPFTPDLFDCEPRPLPTFPPPRKISPKEECVRKELERSRPASHPASGKSSSTNVAIPSNFFKVVFAGVFLAFKYIFIAVAVIITIGCMICAGRQTSGLR